MKPQQLTFILLIALAFQSLRAQQSDPYFTEKETPEYQKLYIHTDRDIYFLGETIWFSAYLLDGQNQVPVVGDQNLIVDLIDTTGNIARSGLYRLADGSSSGGILLTDSIQTGKYVLRAYTNYLRNFGDESFFYKPLSIDRVRSSAVPETASESEILENIEAHFMPEGGFLLENTMNIVAFKITGKGGVEVNTSGYVVDEKGENVAGFQTEYQGMGKFNFYPIPGEKYKAVLDVIPGKYFDLGEIKTAGIKIQNIENIRQDFIRVGIYTNSPEFLNKPYILACMNHGEVIFTEEVVSVQDITEVKILKSLPGGGINRLVLLNENLMPLSERLIFSDNYELVEPVISLSDSSFSTRQKVSALIMGNDDLLFGEKCRLSMAVVNENSLNALGVPQTIRSYLLLGSELNGYIESPESYFEGSPGITSAEKLDLLMQTHGWSNYRWDKIVEMDAGSLEYKITGGIDVTGYVKHLWRKKQVENGEVILFFYTNKLNTISTETDKNGRFTFEHIFVTDTTNFAVIAKNEKDKQNTEIFLDSIEIKPLDFETGKYAGYFTPTQILVELYRQKYFARQAEIAFEPEKGSIMIKEVEVQGTQPEKLEVKFSQIYSEPDIAVQIEEEDFMDKDVFELLKRKAPGMFGVGSQAPVSVNAGSGFLYLIDGSPIPREFIKDIPISSFDRIDIIKSSNPTGTGIYGARGAGGVVCIYTKRGSYETREFHIKGLLTKRINGFSQTREFYSPEYTPENIGSEKPDHRTTLYWNPEIVFKNNSDTISFFTCDNLARYKIFVEGISETGKIILGEAGFEVNTFYQGIFESE